MDKAKKRRVRVNVLCLAGALLSFGCCLLPWTISHVSTERGFLSIQLTPSGFALQNSAADLFQFYLNLPQWPQVVFGCAILLVGIALSFASPLGGFVQLGGIALFRLSVNDYLGFHQNQRVQSIDTTVSLTFYLSVVGALVVISSLFFQFSPDFHSSSTKLKDRLIAFSMFKPQAKTRSPKEQ